MEGHTYPFYRLEEDLERLLWQQARDLLDAGLEQGEVVVEPPPQPEFGDYSSPLCLRLARRLGRPPVELAEELKGGLVAELPRYVAEVTVTHPGYLNFRLAHRQLTREVLDAVGVEGENYGRFRVGRGKKLVIEHTNINPNKAAHIGHLRNACLGDTLARLKRGLGYEVEVQNYIDDTGAAVADIVVGLHYLKRPVPSSRKFDDFCWDLYAEVNQLYETDPELRRQQAQVLDQIERGGNEVADLAKKVAHRIVNHHLETVWQLAVYYNLLTWESDILSLGFWEHAFEQLQGRGSLVRETEGPNAGCWVVRLGDVEEFQHLENPDKVLVRSNGTATYTAKDIAYQLWKFGVLGRDFLYDRYDLQPDGTVLWTTTPQGSRMERFGRADQVINVIDLRQKYLQDVLRLSLDQLGFTLEAANSVHFAYEVVSLSAGTARELGVDVEEEAKEVYAMSGRQGIGVKAEELLERMVDKCTGEVARRHPELEASEHRGMALDIAVGAVRYYMIKYNINSVIVFDFDAALNVQGNTGPYLQYAHARACSILRRVPREERDEMDIRAVDIPPDLTGEERELIKRLALYPTFLLRAGEGLQPALLAEYAYSLARTFMDFYERVPVLGAGEKELPFRLALLLAFRQTLGNALDRLGIPAPERM